jgi:hypothetical protein
MLAPIALEHLGKAALWNRNPALLVPLSSNNEESPRILTAQPDLTNPRLKTVGLGVVLQRLERCIDPFPLSSDSVRIIGDTRNGSVHARLKGKSRQLLRDILSLCDALIEDIGTDSRSFYGDQEENVRGLLNEQRSEVEAAVAAKMARARNHLLVLEGKLGHDLFDDTAATLEADAPFAIDPGDWSSFRDSIAVNKGCPQCGRNGRLIGRLDADPEVDWDVEKIGDTYETYVSGTYWLLSFTPQSFQCNVCKLGLNGHDELAAARLPSGQYDIDTTELDDDFDVDEYTRSISSEVD